VLRHRLLSAYRQKAIEMTLRRIDIVGVPHRSQEIAELYTTRNALDWQLTPSAAVEIESRVQSCGLDQHAISMEVYVQARELLTLYGLLNGAQVRRLLLLKEIDNFRHSSEMHLNRRQTAQAPQGRQGST